MALWTPDLISPHTWIDFSDTSTLFDATSGGSAVTNGVGIARAEDKSGNARHFTQATSGARPTYTSNVQNSLGVARYDGGDYLTSSSAASTWNFLHSEDSTAILVLKNGTTSNPVAYYGWMGTNASSSVNRGYALAYDDRALTTGMTDAFSCLCSAGSVVIVYASTESGTNAVVTDFRNVITPNTFGLFSVLSEPDNATAASRVKLSVNGNSLVGNSSRTGTLSTSDATYSLQLGATGNNTLTLTGDYCEVLLFNSLLSTTDRQLCEGYLAWKWGTEALLPNTHPYYSAAPTIGMARRLINDGLLNRGLFNTGLMR